MFAKSNPLSEKMKIKGESRIQEWTKFPSVILTLLKIPLSPKVRIRTVTIMPTKELDINRVGSSLIKSFLIIIFPIDFL